MRKITYKGTSQGYAKSVSEYSSETRIDVRVKKVLTSACAAI